MPKQHHYKATIKWTGNRGTGTDYYLNYDRSHQIMIKNKVMIEGSSDAAFRGDITKHNPEDMLLASLSTCHMLWYLHLCADAGVIVVEYIDQPTGVLTEFENEPSRFTEANLNPTVTVTESHMIDKARDLHELAHKKCFIANSVNFPVMHKPEIKVI